LCRVEPRRAALRRAPKYLKKEAEEAKKQAKKKEAE
jgi:hypothetical protein